MALFKIEKGLAENLTKNRPYSREGNCYFTTNDGKFYIDTAGDGESTSAVIGTNRIPLNAYKSDWTTKVVLSKAGDTETLPAIFGDINSSELKYGNMGIKNNTFVIPNNGDSDELMIENSGSGAGIKLDHTGGASD